MGKLLENCALCDHLPEIETKPASGKFSPKSGKWIRYVCVNIRCPGHNSRWHYTEGRAARVWNSSQFSKRSVIRRAFAAQRLVGAPNE